MHLMDYLRKKGGLTALEETVTGCEEYLLASAHDDPDHERPMKEYETTVARFNATGNYSYCLGEKEIWNAGIQVSSIQDLSLTLTLPL